MRWIWSLVAVAPVVLASSSTQEGDQSLLWGTYRPNLYFGLRPRLPHSLMSGLMWWGNDDYKSFSQIRHACDQDDGLDGYTWTEHDMRLGGVQVLRDSKNNLNMTVEWLKVPGGQHGGSWAARIKGKPLSPAQPLRLSLIYYFGQEGLGQLNWESEKNPHGIIGPVRLSGNTPDLGNFYIRMEDAVGNQYTTTGNQAAAYKDRIGKTHYVGMQVEPGAVWKAKEMLFNLVVRPAQSALELFKNDPQGFPPPAFLLTLPDEIMPGSNFFAVQKTLEGEFSVNVIYEAEDVSTHIDDAFITKGISTFVDGFTARFQRTFPIPDALAKGYLSFSKAITSNLMGGIGYFYGASIVDRAFKHEWDQGDEDDDEEVGTPNAKSGQPRLTAPRGLLTATPSRPFFPRGFYWDEGFHLLLVGAWDPDLSLEILKDWVGLIDDDGWVAREQILGEEARSKVPEEFQAQYPSNANPPTLTMAVAAFIDRLERVARGPSDEELGLGSGVGSQYPVDAFSESPQAFRHLQSRQLAVDYLREVYPALRRHYEWFRRTQRGLIKQYGRKARSRSEAYRWRGRSKDHVLTSGMDDYPRGAPHAGELHVDLLSWMAFFSRTMKRIAEFLEEEEDLELFADNEKAILGNLDDLHWIESEKAYCDLSIDDNDDSIAVCHKGYLSLFPLLLGLLEPSSPKLGHILDLMQDPAHLWSRYGLRSLSASHPLFGQGENYWRGPIWIQMNYMALSALHKKYAVEGGPYQAQARKIYTELRENVISNVFREYERTGYVWEQYDALTGQGKRSHPFTGWTSLVTLIISEQYH